MEAKLRFVLILFVVSEASPQPPPPSPPPFGGNRPPFGDFDPSASHHHGRYLERHRPLPDRPVNLNSPFFNDNNPANKRFDNQRDPSRFDSISQDKRRLLPRPIGADDNGNANLNAQLVEQSYSKINDEDSMLPQGHKILKASTDVIIARISEGLEKNLKHVQNFAKHRVINMRKRQNVFKNSENGNMDISNNSTVVTTTTPKTSDTVKLNKKTDRVETKLDSLNNVDSNLLNQIFGSAEDESSTTESTTEFETTTLDEFNRIAAPPAVVASLLG